MQQGRALTMVSVQDLHDNEQMSAADNLGRVLSRASILDTVGPPDGILGLPDIAWMLIIPSKSLFLALPGSQMRWHWWV